MAKNKVELCPDTIEILKKMGEQIRLARLRRDITIESLAWDAGISRSTLWAVEKGSPSVSIGVYASVLHVMNKMDQDFLNVAKDEEKAKRFSHIKTTRKRASNSYCYPYTLKQLRQIEKE